MEKEPSRAERAKVEEFISTLDDFVPAIPDEVVKYYLQKSGFVCNDPRLLHLISLATQKFVADVSSEAMHCAQMRTQQAKSKKDKKLVLTMEDLTSSLQNVGVNVKKPEYLADSLSAGTSSKEKR
eukprot:GILI01009873.1.p1 GENE.GILI01009873.1~~GILI01009873.1.p1  ORF type:complete len:125 (+),score=11.53 GILI01009873.1:30-404(+)